MDKASGEYPSEEDIKRNKKRYDALVEKETETKMKFSKMDLEDEKRR